jgi:N-acetylneuraminic acid mutarotase
MKLKKSAAVTVCAAFLLSLSACAGSGSEERAGSSAPSSRSVRSAEPFSTVLPPAAVKRWEEKAPLHTARYDFSIETVGGQIYAIGGENRSGFLSSAEAYDPKTDTWKTIQSMSVPRSNTQTIVLGGKIYVFGGYTSGPNAPVCTGSAERYDPKTDTWKTLKPMEQGKAYHRVTICNGRIYVIGGSEEGTILSSVESYDPKTGKWTPEAPLPAARMHFGVKTISGKIYVFGGSSPLSTLNSVEAYDPVKKQWTKKASMKTPRFSFQTETVGGKIYAIGGIDDKGNLLSSVEEYDPLLNRWTEKSAMHTPRSWFRTAAAGGKIFAVGGLKSFYFQSQDFIPSLEEYDPNSDCWTVRALMNPVRCSFQATAADGGIYVIGGEISEKAGIPSVEKYTVDGK